MSNTSPSLLRRMFGFIGRSFKELVKNIFRMFIRIALLLVLLAMILFVLTQPKPIPDNVALEIAPEGVLVEQLSFTSPLSQLTDSPAKETLVRDLTDAIDAAAKDSRINSIVLNLGDMKGASLSKLEQIGASLTQFKKSGKPVIAVGDNYDQHQYFLASHADHIYLNPFGSVKLIGFGSFRPYFKEALDKLKINVHIFKVGSFKDAVEPFTRTNMSPESRLHNSEWVNSLWNTYTGKIESLRNLPAGAIDNYIATMATELEKRHGDTAQLAVDAGLVNELKTHEQVHQSLIQTVGANSEANGPYSKVDYKRYLQDVGIQNNTDKMLSKNKIAVIVAKGEILDGEQPAGIIGGDSLEKLLFLVSKDDDVAALVLRVDSPGGSAFASEIIRQGVLRVKEKKIPVIVSMGSIAASGGYWIAADADQIWASPTTLTGSIGVFGIVPTIEKSLAELGINIDGVSSTKLADFASPIRPMSDDASRVIQSAVDGIYLKFLKVVEEGRHLKPNEVDKVAQGRIWTGIQAQKLGLVDKLGNLDDAIAAAAEIANVKEYQVKYVEKALTPQEMLMRELSNGNIKLGHWFSTKQLLPDAAQSFWNQTVSPLITELNVLNDPQNYYLRCYDCTHLR